MFESTATKAPGEPGVAPAFGPQVEPVGVAELRLLLARLALDSPAEGDAARVDRLTAMEQVKNALCAAQAREAVDFDASQRESQRAAGFAEVRVGQGIAEQIALARMTSPWRGNRLLGLAQALTELPECSAALTRGEVSEWRVSAFVREIIHLDLEHRQLIDAQLGPLLGELGDRESAGRARAMAQRLDPAAAVARNAKAESERRVSIRPAPDCMTYVSALLPMRDGVAVYAALERLAKEAAAQQSPLDKRGKGALMADELVERVTGRARGTVPIRLGIVMTDAALVGLDESPAVVTGPLGERHGTVPAEAARAWMRHLLSTQVVNFADLVAVNRLFTRPDSSDLVAMESTKMHYTGLLRRMLTLRDQHCRTPWCNAAIRDIDHVHRRTQGGPTSYHNGRGTCTRCNHAREAPGWDARVTNEAAERHEVTLTTPTGHRYSGTAPPLIETDARPGSGPALASRSGPRTTRAG